MKRPLAYITAAWCGSDAENAKQAAQYCRSVYEAGFSPICPTLFHPLFLNDATRLQTGEQRRQISSLPSICRRKRCPYSRRWAWIL